MKQRQTPLIFLTKGGVLELLQIVSQEIVVPAAVATEIQQCLNYIVHQYIKIKDYRQKSHG